MNVFSSFRQIFRGKRGLVLALLVGHLMLVCAAGCHFGCELVSFCTKDGEEENAALPNKVGPELRRAANDHKLEEKSDEFILLFSAGLYFAGYSVLLIVSVGEIANTKKTSVNSTVVVDADDPYALDRWADDGGPCC